MTTELKHKNGTKTSTVLSREEFSAAQEVDASWHYILGTVGQEWSDCLSEKWQKSPLRAFEFYLQEIVPLQTKLGRYLSGHDNE